MKKLTFVLLLANIFLGNALSFAMEENKPLPLSTTDEIMQDTGGACCSWVVGGFPGCFPGC